MNNRALALLALIVALGLFFAYVNPTWTGVVAETQAAIASSEAALKAADEYKARQDELVAERNAIDPVNLKKLTTMLPHAVDNVSLILALNALAARSGFSLTSIDVSSNTAAAATAVGGTNASPVSSIDLSLSAVGSYKAFHTFLDGVEKSQRLIDVRNLTITAANSGLYTYQMTLRLYWLR